MLPSRPQQNIPVWPVSEFVPAKVFDMLRPRELTSYANRTQLGESRIKYQVPQFHIRTDCVGPQMPVIDDSGR